MESLKEQDKPFSSGNLGTLDIEKYFLSPRFEVIIDYPKPAKGEIGWYVKGEVISPVGDKFKPYLEFPQLFRIMQWFEKRSTTDFLHIKNIEVINPSYYLKGDIVPVTMYDWTGLDTVKPQIIGFHIGGKLMPDGRHIGGHSFKLADCLPSQKSARKIY